MQITLISARRDDTLTLIRAGDVLIINGDPLDLTDLPEGGTLPFCAVASEWIRGPITRQDGVLHIPVLLPLPWIPQPAPEEARAMIHPAPIIVTTDGPITLPIWSEPEIEPQDTEEDAA